MIEIYQGNSLTCDTCGKRQKLGKINVKYGDVMDINPPLPKKWILAKTEFRIRITLDTEITLVCRGQSFCCTDCLLKHIEKTKKWAENKEKT